MVLSRKKLRNRIFKISFSFVISVLALVLGFTTRSDAKAEVTFTPTTTNNYLYTFDSHPFSITISHYDSYNGATQRFKYFSFTNLDYSTQYPSSQFNFVKQNINSYSGNVAYCSKWHDYSNVDRCTYFGTYFSNRYFLDYLSDDFSSSYVNLYNHLQLTVKFTNFTNNLYIFGPYDSYGSDVPSTSAYHNTLYILPMFRNSSLYYTQHPNISNYYTATMPSASNYSTYGIDTGLKLYNYYGMLDEETYGYTLDDLIKDGIVIDVIFNTPLSFSDFNSFFGLYYDVPFKAYSGNLGVSVYASIDYVTPRSFGLDSAYDEGYSEGFNDGKGQGYQNGYNDGVSSVDTNSYYDNGYDSGYTAGQNSVDVNAIRQNAFTEGRNAGLSVSSADYGIKDLLYSIFDVPINVLSNLFSFTIFGANVWTIIISLLVVLVVLWIVSRVMGIVFAGGGKK